MLSIMMIILIVMIFLVGDYDDDFDNHDICVIGIYDDNLDNHDICVINHDDCDHYHHNCDYYNLDHLRLHPHLNGLTEHLKHAHAVVQLIAACCEHPQCALRELLPGGQ